MVKRVLPEDPTGEFVHLIEQFEGGTKVSFRSRSKIDVAKLAGLKPPYGKATAKTLAKELKK